jgi:hypothetical protein
MLTILMHQMRISTNQVSLVMLRSKKLKIQGGGGEDEKMILVHIMYCLQARDHVVHI